MLEIQSPFPIVPFLKGGPVFPNEEQYITHGAPHSESGVTVHPGGPLTSDLWSCLWTPA